MDYYGLSNVGRLPSTLLLSVTTVLNVHLKCWIDKYYSSLCFSIFFPSSWFVCVMQLVEKSTFSNVVHKGTKESTSSKSPLIVVAGDPKHTNTTQCLVWSQLLCPAACFCSSWLQQHISMSLTLGTHTDHWTDSSFCNNAMCSCRYLSKGAKLARPLWIYPLWFAGVVWVHLAPRCLLTLSPALLSLAARVGFCQAPWL